MRQLLPSRVPFLLLLTGSTFLLPPSHARTVTSDAPIAVTVTEGFSPQAADDDADDASDGFSSADRVAAVARRAAPPHQHQHQHQHRRRQLQALTKLTAKREGRGAAAKQAKKNPNPNPNPNPSPSPNPNPNPNQKEQSSLLPVSQPSHDATRHSESARAEEEARAKQRAKKKAKEARREARRKAEAATTIVYAIYGKHDSEALATTLPQP